MIDARSSRLIAPSAQDSTTALSRLASLAAFIVAAIHIPVIPEHMEEVPYLGVLFVALTVGCFVLAWGLLITESSAVLVAASTISAAAIAGYVLTRLIALPGHAHDVGSWLDPLGLAAISSEAVVIGACVGLLRRRRLRPTADTNLVRVPWKAMLIGTVATVVLTAMVAGLLVTGAEAGHSGSSHDHGTQPQPADVPAIASDDPAATLLAAQLVAAESVAAQWPTAADALADGWTLAEDYAVQVGAHYMRYSEIDSVFVVDRPEMLLYGGDQLTSPVVGLAYYVVDREPEGFAGETDIWHQHLNVCIGPDGPLWGADGVGICASDADSPVGTWAWMLHAWVISGWESPAGVFSTANPSLP